MAPPIIHNLSTSKFYRIYFNLDARCNKPKHPRYLEYGGKGIKCEWKNFLSFKLSMYEKYLQHCKKYGEKNTIFGRYDNTLNYNDSNATFFTKEYSAFSRSTTIWATYKIGGVQKTAANYGKPIEPLCLPLIKMAEKTKIPYYIIKEHYKRGRQIKDIVRYYRYRQRNTDIHYLNFKAFTHNHYSNYRGKNKHHTHKITTDDIVTEMMVTP